MGINRPPLKLSFSTPEFTPGTQTTVRVGSKWRDDLGTGQPRIPVFVTGFEDKGSIGVATVTSVLFGKFSRFAGIGAATNHQENCRTVEGLAEELALHYSDFDPESSEITVIFFEFAENKSDEELADDATDAADRTAKVLADKIDNNRERDEAAADAELNAEAEKQIVVKAGAAEEQVESEDDEEPPLIQTDDEGNPVLDDDGNPILLNAAENESED